MAIEDNIMALLHSPEVQKIRFVAEAVRIGCDRYEAVAKKLKEGLVTVDIEPDLDDAQPRLSHYEAEGIAYIAAALTSGLQVVPLSTTRRTPTCRSPVQSPGALLPPATPFMSRRRMKCTNSAGRSGKNRSMPPCGSPAVQRRHLITDPLPTRDLGSGVGIVRRDL